MLMQPSMANKGLHWLWPRLTAKQITAIVGPPEFITGCAVTGDLAALAAGQRTELGLQPASPSPTPPMPAPG